MPISVSHLSPSAGCLLYPSFESLPGPMRLGCLDVGIIGIRNIQFPLPIRVDVETGTCEVSMRGFTRTVCYGQSRLVPALEEVSLILLRHARVTLTFVPESGPGFSASVRGQDRGALCQSMDDSRQRKPVTAGISLAVFAAPQSDWGLSSAAAWLGTLDRRWLSRKLLQECSSLRQLVRTQRLSRFVFDLLSSAAQSSAASYGFSDQCCLENAVYDQFGISVAALSRLSFAGHA